MAKFKLQTRNRTHPMIYAFTTSDIPHLNGWVKIGKTEKQSVEERIRQEVHTIGIKNYKIEWARPAMYDDEQGGTFSDTDFHDYLVGLGIKRDSHLNSKTEWFNISPKDAEKLLDDYKKNRGIINGVSIVNSASYKLREEQEDAVQKTLNYINACEDGKIPPKEFLWNAKPRFGKTLAAYELCRRKEYKNILIVTNRPAIADSWYNDYEKFLGKDSGYRFVSVVDVLENRELCVTREEYVREITTKNLDLGCIEFVSLQNLKRSKYFDGYEEKLKEVADIVWDILIIDEAHEGVDTYKVDKVLDKVNRKFTLHMSGTSFKAIAKGKFEDEVMYSWTYVDEQRKKEEYEQYKGISSPYDSLPRLSLVSYQMSELIKDKNYLFSEEKGSMDFAFDLNKFFETKPNTETFIFDEEVDKFLDVISSDSKYPFGSFENRNEIKHTLWRLHWVDSAKALKRKLEKHPVFKEYKVILAAGKGDSDEDWKSSTKALNKVRTCIAKYDKTITLSVGQLTAGVTIPEWTAVLMLSNLRSVNEYVQTAFRVTNPWILIENGEVYKKYNSFVFDFDSIRSFANIEALANDLSYDYLRLRYDLDNRIKNIDYLLKYLPVYAENELGELIEYSADKILSRPREIRSNEVVNSCFMSNFLFNNNEITQIFSAPKEVMQIINSMNSAPKSKRVDTIEAPSKEDLCIDENNNVVVSDEMISEKVEEVFNNCEEDIISELEDNLTSNNLVENVSKVNNSNKNFKNSYKEEQDLLNKSKQDTTNIIAKKLIDRAEKKYGSNLTPTIKRVIRKEVEENVSDVYDKAHIEYKEKRESCEVKLKDKINQLDSTEKIKDVKSESMLINEQLGQDMLKNITDGLDLLLKETESDIVAKVETNIKEKQKAAFEDEVRDKLRGFARSISSFIMCSGFGNNLITLKNFDKIVSEEEFKELTGITLSDFKLLRDGGEIIDSETGKPKHFKGNLFDEVVFNDSIKLFYKMAYKFANYFSSEVDRDIFYYMAAQRTNQIFTPRHVVEIMTDVFEEMNPGIFDNPNNTFVDFYIKSGLYISTIVKRLFRSKRMCAIYPNDEDRIRHIFEHQIYGMAPTHVIYKIATNYLLGFDAAFGNIKHNIKEYDFMTIPNLPEPEIQKFVANIFEVE